MVRLTLCRTQSMSTVGVPDNILIYTWIISLSFVLRGSWIRRPYLNTNKKKFQKDAKNSAYEDYLSYLFILVADSGRFQGLRRALDNQFLLDKDAYPTTMPRALKLLEKFKAECSWFQLELTSTWNPHMPCIHGNITYLLD